CPSAVGSRGRSVRMFARLAIPALSLLLLTGSPNALALDSTPVLELPPIRERSTTELMRQVFFPIGAPGARPHLPIGWELEAGERVGVYDEDVAELGVGARVRADRAGDRHRERHDLAGLAEEGPSPVRHRIATVEDAEDLHGEGDGRRDGDDGDPEHRIADG